MLAVVLLNSTPTERLELRMSEAKTFPVYDETGCIGVLLASARFLDSRPDKTIRLTSGEEIQVPGSALKVQPDGSFRLLRLPLPNLPENRPESPGAPRSAANQTEPSPAPPPPQPSASVPPASVARASFFQDDYEIERVAVGRLLDEPIAQRHEGDTLVLPVVEEVLVYEKKLYLREEIRITRRKKPVGEVRKIEQQNAAKASR